MKTYVITAGCYSDYHILAICSTKEKAEAAAFAFGNAATVTEWEMDKVPNFPPGMSLWLVEMTRKGTVLRCSSLEAELTDTTTLKWEFYKNNFFFECCARDEKHAIKIANEKRTELIATGQERNPQFSLWEPSKKAVATEQDKE
jgi:hypothetical protein